MLVLYRYIIYKEIINGGTKSFRGNYEGTLIDKQNVQIWYYGSPYKLDMIRTGSSITRNKELAKAFSHKPSGLSVDENGTIAHNGKEIGYLSVVDELLKSEDIYVHEACREENPWEWLTNRDFKFKLIERLELAIIK